MRGLMAATMSLALAAGTAQAQTVSVSGLAGQSLTLSAADIAALPHQPVTLELEGGRSEACEGVALNAILAKVGAPQGKALRGPEMADVVLVSAADGYHVALALAETDPLIRGDRVFLADRCDGKPLAAGEGPFRMIVLEDRRPARSARQVTAIKLARVGG